MKVLGFSSMRISNSVRSVISMLVDGLSCSLDAACVREDPGEKTQGESCSGSMVTAVETITE